ncbi:hypothetical protein [Xenophilus azovorans]|uniref:hypothetical protein n=1 Tax=Xenophilus TaxID=151754 RepID=UPI000690714F|nr:hypothetical protein [Xenophilus azovorans]
MAKTRQVIMQVLTRSGEEWNHVEFTLDDHFAERLRQLRTLVPPLNNLNRNRDLVIDKVRVRLPSAVWRCGGPGEGATEVDGSSIVVAAEGFFNCGGKKRSSREKLVTYTFPIARLIELHLERPDGEAFFLRNGLFTNDEPAHSSAGRWVASLHVPEQAAVPVTDFDTMPGSPVPLAHPRRSEDGPAPVRVLN